MRNRTDAKTTYAVTDRRLLCGVGDQRKAIREVVLTHLEGAEVLLAHYGPAQRTLLADLAGHVAVRGKRKIRRVAGTILARGESAIYRGTGWKSCSSDPGGRTVARSEEAIVFKHECLCCLAWITIYSRKCKLFS
jgi:hypothetical protein